MGGSACVAELRWVIVGEQLRQQQSHDLLLGLAAPDALEGKAKEGT
jgi:hypothetical protein